MKTQLPLWAKVLMAAVTPICMVAAFFQSGWRGAMDELDAARWMLSAGVDVNDEEDEL